MSATKFGATIVSTGYTLPDTLKDYQSDGREIVGVHFIEKSQITSGYFVVVWREK